MGIMVQIHKYDLCVVAHKSYFGDNLYFVFPIFLKLMFQCELLSKGMADADAEGEERFLATGCDALGRVLTIVY